MLMATNMYLSRAMREALRLGCCILLVCGVDGQKATPPPGKVINQADQGAVAGAIEKVKSGNFVGADVDMIRRGGAVEAIPVLEQQFKRVQHVLKKVTIARVLVRLGDKDETYWNFLVKQATPALTSDAPDFVSYDVEGKSTSGPSPAFIAWTKTHNIAPNGPDSSAAEDSVYVSPAKVLALGLTGDPRAIPLLRLALSSPNHMIEIAAAKGLAELQDKESIPSIIDACRRSPAEPASLIAQSLVYFDDPDAQNTVDKYVSKDTAKLLREAKIRGQRTPFTF